MTALFFTTVWLFSLSLLSTIVTGFVARPDQRIVAMGDLHGDLANTLRILKFTGLVDDDAAWSGGDTIWVQTASETTH